MKSEPKKTTKKVPLKELCSWTLGVRATNPTDKIKSEAIGRPRDSAWVLEKSKECDFHEFLTPIVQVAIELGTTEKQKRDYIKKLMGFLADTAQGISHDVDGIESFERDQLRAKKNVFSSPL